DIRLRGGERDTKSFFEKLPQGLVLSPALLLRVEIPQPEVQIKVRALFRCSMRESGETGHIFLGAAIRKVIGEAMQRKVDLFHDRVKDHILLLADKQQAVR